MAYQTIDIINAGPRTAFKSLKYSKGACPNRMGYVMEKPVHTHPQSARSRSARTNFSSSDYMDKYRSSRNSTCITERKSRKSLRPKAPSSASRVYKDQPENMVLLSIQGKDQTDSGMWFSQSNI